MNVRKCYKCIEYLYQSLQETDTYLAISIVATIPFTNLQGLRSNGNMCKVMASCGQNKENKDTYWVFAFEAEAIMEHFCAYDGLGGKEKHNFG